MPEKKNDEETPKAKEDPKSAGAKKTAAKKPAAKKSAEKKPEKKTEAPEKPTEEEIEAGPGEEKPAAEPEPERVHGTEKEELSEEEFRSLVEESLETVTVADIVLTMMNQLASVGYMKMGLPESVNLKYRDFTQAGLAIDTLEAMIKGAEDKVSEDLLQPFKGTLANLQMNFFQLKRGQP